jgi:hypothetical protein
MRQEGWFEDRQSGQVTAKHQFSSEWLKLPNSLFINGCPGWDRTSDQVINSFLVQLFQHVCNCLYLTSLTALILEEESHISMRHESAGREF